MHKTPTILGAEDAQAWKIKKAKLQETEHDLITFGYSFMTNFNLKKFEAKVRGGKKSDATKATNNPESQSTLTPD